MFNRANRQSGSAIVMVLMVSLIVGAVGVAAWQRSQSSSDRTNQQTNVDKARAAADAGLEMAVQRIVQVGSTSSDESGCALLDFPPKISDGQPSCDTNATAGTSRNPTISGYSRSSDAATYSTGEATFSYTIRGTGTSRTITSTGIFSPSGNPTSANAFKAVKTQKIAVTSRALRYGLFSSGDRASAVQVKANGQLLLPPTNKTGKAKSNRGSDLGANTAISVIDTTTGGVNKKELNTSLYEGLFGSVGLGQATSAATSGNTSPSSTGNFRVDGAVLRRSNTALPSIGGVLSALRLKAQAVTDRKQYFNVRLPADRTALATLLSADREMTGVVMIENKIGDCPFGTLGVQITNSMLIKNGSLVVAGCNLSMSGSGYSLFIDHPLASNTDAAADVNKLPALVVYANADDKGGNVTISPGDVLASAGSVSEPSLTSPSAAAAPETTGSAVTLEGASFISGDLTVRAATAAPTGGHLNSNGALLVGGSTSIGGGAQPSVVVARWNPLAQEVAVDSIGTYTVKSYDRPSATPSAALGVSVTLTNKPPDASLLDADYGRTDGTFPFAWTLADNYEDVTCTLTNLDTNTVVSTSDCAFLAKTVTGLLLDTKYKFTVKACTIKYGQTDKNDSSNGDFNSAQPICGGDSSTFYVPPQSLAISINTASKPAATSQSTTANFGWTVSGGSARKTNTFQCQLNNGGWGNCSSPSAQNLTSLAAGAYGTDYTFQVKVTNGYSTATDTYSWKLLPAAAPVLQFTATPPGTAAYTQRTGSFTWKVSNSVAAGKYQCSLDGAAWTQCTGGDLSTSMTTASLDNNAVYGVAHSFQVRAENIIGWSSAITYGWTIYPDPPTKPFWGASPPTVDYPSGSSQGWFESYGPARILKCYSAAYGWWDCSNGAYFAAGGYCSNTYVRVAAWNVTAWVDGDGASFHRNCQPPSFTLRWTTPQYPGVSNSAYHYIEQAAGANTYPTGCDMYHWLYGGAVTGSWWHGTWCNNPAQPFGGAPSFLRHILTANASDNSRSGTWNEQEGYNSVAGGWTRIK